MDKDLGSVLRCAGRHEGELDEAVQRYPEKLLRVQENHYVLFSEEKPVYLMLLLKPKPSELFIFGGNTFLTVGSRTEERNKEILRRVEEMLEIEMGLPFSKKHADPLIAYMSSIFLTYEHNPKEAMRLLTPQIRIIKPKYGDVGNEN